MCHVTYIKIYFGDISGGDTSNMNQDDVDRKQTVDLNMSAEQDARSSSGACRC